MCKHILGMSDEELGNLLAEGVIEIYCYCLLIGLAVQLDEGIFCA